MTSATAATEIRLRQTSGRGTPLFPDEPQTLAELFKQAAAKFSKPDALNHKKNGRWHAVSSAELMRGIEETALGLYSLGLRKGDRAAILAPNSPDWTIADAGCHFAGVIDVPIYTTLAPHTVRFIIEDAGARVLFIENADAFDRIKDEIAACDSIERIVFFRGEPAGGARSMSFAALLDEGARLRETEPHLINDISCAAVRDDVATLIYTSGTTGEPKGVMLTHGNIISNLIDSGEKYSFSAADIPLSVLPLSHIFERAAMYLYILHGMSVHYAESVDKVPENLREVRPTIFVGVPRIFEKVYARAKLNAAQSGGVKETLFDRAIDVATRFALSNERGERAPLGLRLSHAIADRLVFTKLREFFGGRLRFCITGGAALSDDIYLIFHGAGIPIMQGYGLTETSPVISSNNPSEIRLGTVGKPIRNVSVRIAADGEVEAAGPGVMAGYYRNERATSEAFTVDGWFRNGDIGTLDPDGFLRITDRKKELFKTSGGKYIAPSPIEQMIRSSRFVNQAVLVGNGRKFAAALIVPNFDMLASYARVKGLDLKTPSDFCTSERIRSLIERQVAAVTAGLARYETIKKVALLENELSVEGGELTPTLKIKRRVVDEKYKALIDQLYREE